MSLKNKDGGKSKGKIRPTLRVALSKDAERKIIAWKNEIEADLHGQRIYMSTFISKLIELTDFKLQKNTKAKLTEHFFDPIIAVEKAAAQARQRMKNGEDVSIQEILKELGKHAEVRALSAARKKTKKRGENEVDGTTVSNSSTIS